MSWNWKHSWRIAVGVLIGWLVVREFGVLDFQLADVDLQWVSSANTKRRDEPGIRNRIDRAEPMRGMDPVFGLASHGSPDDRDFARRLQASIESQLRSRFADDPRLGDASIEVEVVLAAQSGVAWLPLWKELSAEVAIEIAVAPVSPPGPVVDFISQARFRVTTRGSCTARRARENRVERIATSLGELAATSIRKQLESR